jgi:fumarate hydratase subunit alpha
MTLREVDVAEVTAAIRQMCLDAAYKLGDDVVAAISDARDREESPVGKDVLGALLENAAIAAEGVFPYCQDTGSTVVFMDVGQDVHLVGGDVVEAVNEGVRQGYTEGFLRASIVEDPMFGRTNTGDNTPAFLHTRIVPGDQVRITVDAKGGGSENKSRHVMLVPADGVEGVRRFVLETVTKAGADCCPPGIIGVGVGGNFEWSAILAKRALLRHVGEPNPDPELAALERSLLADLQALGIGPQAMGGTVSAFAVHVETLPTHIASLPVAVNIECHAHRTRTVEL